MKIRASAKIAIGFIILVLAAYFGWGAYTAMTVMKIKFPPIQPGHVSIIGINSDQYHIIVANQAAQVVKGGGGKFDSDQSGPENEDSAEDKKRVPIREMLQAMQGNEAALGQFIAIMNDMQETADWPTQHIVWQEEDLRKAIDGSDPALRKKLENDVNMHLDGTPLSEVSLTAIENGIIVQTYAPCKVQVGDEVRDMKGPIQIPYRPRIAKTIESRLKDKAYDRQDVANYYADEGKKILSGETPKEDIAKSLLALIDAKKNAELALPAQELLKSAQVVCTDKYITSASYNTYPAGDKELHDLSIQLTDEGRNRLWQYSHNRVNSQLLLIVDGIAIAAPRIKHELAQGELQITQMPDKLLVEDAVNAINKKS